MVKIILEKVDIEKMIKIQYPDCEFIDEIPDEFELSIRVKEINVTKTMTSGFITPVKEDVILNDGSIDAEASGKTPPVRKETIPGSAMGKARGGLPIF